MPSVAHTGTGLPADHAKPTATTAIALDVGGCYTGKHRELASRLYVCMYVVMYVYI